MVCVVYFKSSEKENVPKYANIENSSKQTQKWSFVGPL